MLRSLINEKENFSAVETLSLSLLLLFHYDRVVIKSHCNYSFVIWRSDTLIGRHITDNKTLTGQVWDLTPVYDYEN